MKNIFIGLVFCAAFLPARAFADQGSCLAALDQQSQAFFGQQGLDRSNFIKANPTSMANHDKFYKISSQWNDARRRGLSTSGLPSVPAEDSTFAAFQAKQLSDKQVFLAKFYQQRQACLSSP